MTIFRRRSFWIVAAAVVVIAALAVRPPVRFFHAASRTLEPEVPQGTRLVVFAWRFLDRPLRRGDIVVLVAPPSAGRRAGEYFLKRVAGLPGETVAVRGGRLFVNGGEVPEPWRDLSFGPGPDDGPKVVPAGALYLLGDARGISYDSRHWGFAPEANLVGRVVYFFR